MGRAKSGLELLIGAYFYFYFVFLVCEVNLINGTDFGNDVLMSPFPLCTECLPFYPDRAGLCCSAGKQVSRYILFLPAGQALVFTLSGWSEEMSSDLIRKPLIVPLH